MDQRRRFLSLQTMSLLVAVGLVLCNYEIIMKAYSEQATLQVVQMKLMEDVSHIMLPEGSRALSSSHEGCSPGSKRPDGPLNYLRDKEAVIKVFKDCENDPNCYFTYHHVAKSGGTSVEENMFPRFGQDIELTCCHGRILKKFREDPERYCAQKFTSWQVSKNKFTEVVETCKKIRPQSRTVVWTTFREPISTYVSLIHQMCNKNVGKREDHQARACEVCETGASMRFGSFHTALVNHGHDDGKQKASCLA